MQEYTVTVRIKAANLDRADEVRQEIVAGIEDGRDSNELAFPFDFEVGHPVAVQDATAST